MPELFDRLQIILNEVFGIPEGAVWDICYGCDTETWVGPKFVWMYCSEFVYEETEERGGYIVCAECSERYERELERRHPSPPAPETPDPRQMMFAYANA